MEVMQIKDHHGYRDLLSGNQMMLVPAGTEVKFLSGGDGVAFYVRLLSGTHDGQTGWVLYRQIRHTGPDTRPFPPRVGIDAFRPAPDAGSQETAGPQEPDAGAQAQETVPQEPDADTQAPDTRQEGG
jgi:hypothetical protein